MKKRMIGIGLVLAVLVALGATGFALAQDGAPSDPQTPGRGYGMWGGRYGGFGRGMMGGWYGGYGPMHESMAAALAEELGLDAGEVQERIEAGETPWEIALAEGLSEEEVGALMLDAHDAALEQAVEAGVLTEEQAGWMANHMNGFYGQGAGPGSCHGGYAVPGGVDL